MSWPDCAARVRERCGTANLPSKPYKLCDFKFALGDIFREYGENYDFFAFGDIDVIYGDLRRFLTPELLEHDLITFNRDHVSGHLTILRNTDEIRTQYRRCEGWRRAIDDPEYRYLDEHLQFYGIEKAYCLESYNTPLSPYTPWIGGRFEFPGVWYYDDGTLCNNIDGEREFMYLHFMRYKIMWNARRTKSVVHFDPAHPPAHWKLCVDGFHHSAPDDRFRDQGRVIDLARYRTTVVC